MFVSYPDQNSIIGGSVHSHLILTPCTSVGEPNNPVRTGALPKSKFVWAGRHSLYG